MYFFNDFEAIPVAPVITGIASVSNALYFYRQVFIFKIFSASFSLFYLLKFQCLLTDMFLLYYHGQ
jgi:hypothetical protein